MLMLGAKNQLPGRGEKPVPLVLGTRVASDAVEGFGTRAAEICGCVRVVVAGFRIGVLGSNTLRHAVIRRMPDETGICDGLLGLVVLVIVAECPGGCVVTVKIGARLDVVAAQIQFELRGEVIANLRGTGSELARRIATSPEVFVKIRYAGGTEIISGDAPHQGVRLAIETRRAVT